MGQFDAAIDNFGKAVALDPENTQALASRGETLREMGRFEEALGGSQSGFWRWMRIILAR